MPHSLRCKIKHLYHNGTITENERDRILKVLDHEPKVTGHWIKIFLTDTSDINGQCSECGFIYKFIDGYTEKSLECPNCGAKMESEDKENG